MNYISINENLSDAFSVFRKLYEENYGIDEIIYEGDVDVKITTNALSFTYMNFSVLFVPNSLGIPKFKKITSM